jgi:integrase
MAHVQDRWFRKVDGKTVRTPQHSQGMRYRARWTDPGGKQHAKSFPDGQKGRAERFLVGVEADMLAGTYADPRGGAMSFRAYAEDWLERQTFDDSTYESVSQKLSSLAYPVLGDRRLDQLAATPSIIQGWLSGLHCAPSTARRVLAIVSSVFISAIADHKVSGNPCTSRVIRPPSQPRRHVVPLTEGQLAAVRAALPERYAAIVDAGSRAGLRQGEIFGLSPDDIDRTERLIHVRRQLKPLRAGMHFALPKRRKTRTVPLSAAASRLLAQHEAAFPPVEVTLPWHDPGDRRHGEPVTVPLLFTTPTGCALSRHSFNYRVWKPALRAAGLQATPDQGTHAMRHVFSARLIAAGVDIRRIAACLGHDDPAFTLRIYGHLLGDADESVRLALDAADAAAVGLPGEPEDLDAADAAAEGLQRDSEDGDDLGQAS